MVYSLLKPILFRQDPEHAHERVLMWLESLQHSSVGRSILHTLSGTPKDHPVQTMALSFRHPVGMAAGFDKDARVAFALQELGFSFVEIGTVTPKPQPGNPKPRLWRFPEAKALVNALGFPGKGMEAVAIRLEKLRTGNQIEIPIGINIGKNSSTPAEQAATDYKVVLERLLDLGDYFVVNVSSPNTPGLRDLQTVESLKKIIEPLAKISKPLLIKIAPDLNDDDVISISRFVRESNLAGMVSANTTVNRKLVSRASTLDRGGLSGAPLFARTKQLISLVRSELSSTQTLIAVGGISTRDDVQMCLNLGANLVQVYTAFVYNGPGCVKQLTK